MKYRVNEYLNSSTFGNFMQGDFPTRG